MANSYFITSSSPPTTVHKQQPSANDTPLQTRISPSWRYFHNAALSALCLKGWTRLIRFQSLFMAWSVIPCMLFLACRAQNAHTEGSKVHSFLFESHTQISNRKKTLCYLIHLCVCVCFDRKDPDFLSFVDRRVLKNLLIYGGECRTITGRWKRGSSKKFKGSRQWGEKFSGRGGNHSSAGHSGNIKD